jgi:hypothetical protein
MASSSNKESMIRREGLVSPKYLKINSSTVVQLKVTILPGKEEMEWMTEWHYQEVIQLAYATLQNIFEKEKQGISFGHKYSHTLMKGASVRVAFYVRAAPAHCISTMNERTTETLKALPYCLGALVDCHSLHSKEGIMKHIHYPDDKDPSSLFVTLDADASKENVPEFEINTHHKQAKTKGIIKNGASREVVGTKKQNNPIVENQQTLDGFCHLPKEDQLLPQNMCSHITSTVPCASSLQVNQKMSGISELHPSGEKRVQTRDMLKGCKSISAIPVKSLIKWIQHHGTYLIDIMNGKRESRRHAEYFSGNKARADLHYEVVMSSFTEGQRDIFVTALTKMFCTSNPSRYNYVMSVLLPEAVVKLMMDIFNADKQEAEKLLLVGLSEEGQEKEFDRDGVSVDV